MAHKNFHGVRNVAHRKSVDFLQDLDDNLFSCRQCSIYILPFSLRFLR